MEPLRLLPARSDESIVAFGGGTKKSRAELRRLALGFRNRFRSTDEVLLLSEDRFSFVAALLGALEAGAHVVLPPHRGSVAREILAENRLVVSDEGEAGSLAANSVEALEDGSPGRLLAPGDALVTLYTSGTTGVPSATRKTAGQLLGEALVLRETLGLEAKSRVVSTVSPQHIYGLLFGVLAPLLAGASFLRRTSHLGPSIEQELLESAASVLVSVPAHLEGLFSERGFPKTTTVVSSGARLPEHVLGRIVASGAPLFDILGSSETGGFAYRRSESPFFKPFPHSHLVTGEDGVTHLSSPFLDDPSRPIALGDAFEFDDRGDFRHLGRVDDVVKVGGKRVSLGEIEATALALPGVLEAVCLAERTESIRGFLLELYVVAPGYAEALLKEELRARLDPVLVPRRIARVDRIPRQENGKVKRLDLQANSRFLESAKPRFTRKGEANTNEAHPEARNEGVTLVALVSRAHPRFRGHFPGDPLLPAVSELHDLVLPAIEAAFGPVGFVRKITRWKLMAPLRPGSEVEVGLVRKGTRIEFTIVAEEKVLTRGSLELAEGTIG